MHGKVILTHLFFAPISLQLGARVILDTHTGRTYHGIFSGVKNNTIYLFIDDLGELGFLAEMIAKIEEI